MNGKAPFFYRIDAAEFFTVVNSFKSEKETGKYFKQFAIDLITKQPSSEYSSLVISEALEYINKKREAGRKGGKQKASSAKATLEQCHENANSKTVARNSKEAVQKQKNKNTDDLFFTSESGTIYSYEEFFEALWDVYPRKVKKLMCHRSYCKSVKTQKDMVLINEAIRNYTENEIKGKDIQYVAYASTWFNQWRNWVPDEQIALL